VYEQGDSGSAYKRILKAKITKKIKIFMWLVEQKHVLTNDNLLTKFTGDPSFYFCNAPKTPDHLFFECSVATGYCNLFSTGFHTSII
jgi:hypothetical protein